MQQPPTISRYLRDSSYYDIQTLVLLTLKHIGRFGMGVNQRHILILSKNILTSDYLFSVQFYVTNIYGFFN